MLGVERIFNYSTQLCTVTLCAIVCDWKRVLAKHCQRLAKLLQTIGMFLAWVQKVYELKYSVL